MNEWERMDLVGEIKYRWAGLKKEISWWKEDFLAEPWFYITLAACSIIYVLGIFNYPYVFCC